MQYSDEAIGKVFECGAGYRYLVNGRKGIDSISTIMLRVVAGRGYRAGQSYKIPESHFPYLQKLPNCGLCLCLGSGPDYINLPGNDHIFICSNCKGLS